MLKLLLVAILVAAGGCSYPEGDSLPARQATRVIDTGSYAIENAALDRAMTRTGLPREASLWIQRTADGVVVCGALARPEGKPVLYLTGPSGGYIGAPLASVTPEVGRKVLDTANRAVLTNCGDHGLTPPERILRMLSDQAETSAGE